MREITPEEIMLISGASGTATFPTVTVTGQPSSPPVTVPPSTGGGSPTQPTNPCVPALPEADRADPNFVFNNEEIRATAYVLPPAQFPNSGVTVGAGVDLSKNTMAQLQGWGLSSTGVAQLTPYMGLTGNAAQAALDANGAATLSAADVAAIDSGAFANDVATVTANFNAASGLPVNFSQLPGEAQTVIIDVSYPTGPYLSVGAPNFYADITSGNWSAAVNELNHWNADGTTSARFSNDALVLQTAIDNGTLSSNDSTCQ